MQTTKKPLPIGIVSLETSASTLTNSPKAIPPKLKKNCCNSVAKKQIQNNKLKMKVHCKGSHKKETIHYKSEKYKVSGILAKKVLEIVRKSHGIIIPSQKIQRAVE